MDSKLRKNLSARVMADLMKMAYDEAIRKGNLQEAEKYRNIYNEVIKDIS